MPLQIPRLRRWLAVAAALLLLVIGGVYVHRKRQVRDVFKQIPAKMNVDIQQTAEGFRISKSDQGRTLFTIQASKAVQFKLGGRAELHNVTITLYGRDSSRYDQIYGDDFAYDPQTGDVTAKGEVRIDLEANPEGLLKPDQAIPSMMKNPIHLVTRDLVFNQKTGNAYTNAQVDLHMPQASGSATGIHYAAKDNVMVLDSHVDLALTGTRDAKLKAARAVITKAPRQVVLEGPELTHGAQRVEARKAIVYLRDDNAVDHITANDDVRAQVAGDSPIRAEARQADFAVNAAQDGLSRAVFSGDVQIETGGDRPGRVSAGRIRMEFTARNQISSAFAENNVKIVEFQPPVNVAGSPRSGLKEPSSSLTGQQLEISAPAMNFRLAGGKRIETAETSGPARIVISPASGDTSSTVVTAGKFDVEFNEHSSLRQVHGTPDAKVVNATPGQPDRVSTSEQIDAQFRPEGGIESITQQGSFQYIDGERHARADRATYTPADQMLVLSGSPRIVDKGLVTTARTVRFNRSSGEAIAEGNVKSTYSDLHEQPDGALLASASPIHVTAHSMSAQRNTAVATYREDARLWQDANVVEAATIVFDRDRRSIVAEGNGHPVSTVLLQVDKHGNAMPIAITSGRLTYTDDQRRVHFEGGVTARGSDITITADHVDAFILPRNQPAQNQSVKGQSQFDRLVAEGSVVIREPGREAVGNQLTYTVADDKFVLSGGTPSIFDAERGKIKGDSLTFFRRDDRVLVEGRDTSPTVTHTRVAR